MSITNLILDEAQLICDEFWATWDRVTTEYPDIEDATVIKLAVFKTTILTLMINYLVSFDPSEREDNLNQFVEALRKSEKSLRDDPNFQ